MAAMAKIISGWHRQHDGINENGGESIGSVSASWRKPAIIGRKYMYHLNMIISSASNSGVNENSGDISSYQIIMTAWHGEKKSKKSIDAAYTTVPLK